MALSYLIPLLSLITLCVGSSPVPLVGWSNRDVLKSVSTTSTNDFLNTLNLENVKLIVMFVSPQLSFNDIAKYGGLYGEKNTALSSLQTQVQTAASSLWGGIKEGSVDEIVTELQFKYGIGSISITGVDKISNLLSDDSKQLFVVRLPDTNDNENGFSAQDHIITQTSTLLSDLDVSYVAFYTANYATRRQETFHSSRLRRDTSQLSTSPTGGDFSQEAMETYCAQVTKNGNPCLLMCLKTPVMLVTKNSTTAVIEDSAHFEFVNGSCGKGDICQDGHCFIATVKFNSTSGSDELMTKTLRFSFVKHQKGENDTITEGFWRMDLYVSDEDSEEVLYQRNRETPHIFTKFEVPLGSSYACGENELNMFVPDNSSGMEDVLMPNIRFNHIQVQYDTGFFYDHNNNPVFGSAYNCEGYFTFVSLMGVFSVIILLIILYCSTVFAFQMNTLDRFDNPRESTITVENLH